MNTYIPNQHGAWAMLIVPFLAGMIAGGPEWLHLPLFLSWLLVYLFSFPLLQWVKTGRSLYRKPMLLYGLLLAPAGAIVLHLMPSLMWWGFAFLPLFLVNCHYARRKQERAFLNDMAAVIQFSLMVWISYQAGGGTEWREAALYFAVCLCYFAGTVFYVKTIIRERNNPHYYRMSVAFHVVCAAVSWLLLPLSIALVSSALLARAGYFPRIGITAKRSGILEIGFAVWVMISFYGV